MAKTMRKKNLKIQMLAGNSLNSFLNASSEENSTLVLPFLCPSPLYNGEMYIDKQLAHAQKSPQYFLGDKTLTFLNIQLCTSSGKKIGVFVVMPCQDLILCKLSFLWRYFFCFNFVEMNDFKIISLCQGMHVIDFV